MIKGVECEMTDKKLDHSSFGRKGGTIVHTMGRERTGLLRAHGNDGRTTEDESDEWMMQEVSYESQWEDTTIIWKIRGITHYRTTSPLEPASASSSSR